jgi:hypothetical protein
MQELPKVGYYQIVSHSKKAIYTQYKQTHKSEPYFWTRLKISLYSHIHGRWKFQLTISQLHFESILARTQQFYRYAATYDAMFANAPLLPVDTQFVGPNRSILDAVGGLNARLQWRDGQSTQAVYAIRDVLQPRLGRDSINALGAWLSSTVAAAARTTLRANNSSQQ